MPDSSIEYLGQRGLRGGDVQNNRRWREYDPEAPCAYALRLHEAGLIKSTPQKIIAEGTDWRFFNELKRELKA
jgi:hypothetical protein